MKKYLIILLGMLFLFVGCSGSKSESYEIAGKEFQLIDSAKEDPITLGFDKEKYFGFSGVNRYFGTYTQEKSKLKLSPAASTLMAGPQELMEKESDYLKTLSTVDEFKLVDKDLTLMSQGKDILKFKQIENK